MLEVSNVSGKSDLDLFIQIPSLLAKGDPNFVDYLWFERRQFLSQKHNPYFNHAEATFFIARKNGRPVGRISAQIDHLLVGDDQGRIGHFGLIDAREDDVLSRLFSAAEKWLGERKVTRIRGPFSLSVNETLGVLIEGFDTPPYVMMDHHDPWLGAAIERNGYEKAKDVVAYRLDVTNGLQDKYRSLANQSYDGLRIRSLDMKHYRDEITTITSIFNDAWADNWGFVPLTEAEIDAMARDLKPILDTDLIKIAELDGKPVAFIVLLPNLNEAIADLKGKLLPFGWLKLLWRLKVSGIKTGRVPLMGVCRDVSDTLVGKVLPLKLIYALEERAVALQFREIELSWLLEDNKPVRRVVEAIGGVQSKTYRIYEKQLKGGE